MGSLVGLVVADFPDSRHWTSHSSEFFLVKSLSKHLLAATPLDRMVFQPCGNLSAQRENILTWVMVCGS